MTLNFFGHFFQYCFGNMRSPFYANRPSGDSFRGSNGSKEKKKLTRESNFSQFMTVALWITNKTTPLIAFVPRKSKLRYYDCDTWGEKGGSIWLKPILNKGFFSLSLIAAISDRFCSIWAVWRPIFFYTIWSLRSLQLHFISPGKKTDAWHMPKKSQIKWVITTIFHV